MKLPESLVGLVFFIPIRLDMDADQSEACEWAMAKVENVKSAGQAMGARPYHLVEYNIPQDGKVDVYEIERKLLEARDSIPADSKYCRACEAWRVHQEYPLDLRCLTCGEWYYGDGQDMTQEEWDKKYNPVGKGEAPNE